MDRQRVDPFEAPDRLLLAVLQHAKLFRREVRHRAAPLVEHRGVELHEIDVDRFGARLGAQDPDVFGGASAGQKGDGAQVGEAVDRGGDQGDRPGRLEERREPRLVEVELDPVELLPLGKVDLGPGHRGACRQRASAAARSGGARNDAGHC